MLSLPAALVFETCPLLEAAQDVRTFLILSLSLPRSSKMEVRGSAVVWWGVASRGENEGFNNKWDQQRLPFLARPWYSTLLWNSECKKAIIRPKLLIHVCKCLGLSWEWLVNY
jgi:hypothetical protein